jgi:5-methylcytosine-specific restriction endonuclease McrA
MAKNPILQSAGHEATEQPTAKAGLAPALPEEVEPCRCVPLPRLHAAPVHSRQVQGLRSPELPNGQAAQLRSTRAWQVARQQARHRDGYKCVVCGSRFKLEVHHIVSLEEDGSAFNFENLQNAL